MATSQSEESRWDDHFMRWLWWGRPAATTIEERTRRRVWLHLLPILFGLYILAYIDRSNIAVAKFGMNRPVEEQGLGFNNEIIGFGSGIFFWGYWILEIPSTLSVERRGARRVFFRILVMWGLVAVLMGFMGMPIMETLFGWLPQLPTPASWPWLASIARHWNELGTNPESQFYFLRFMLGFFEGGFFPTVVMYLSIWFKAQHRGKAMASFMAAMPLSMVLGTPLSQWIGDNITWGGLASWRWIYILEGIAPVLAGVGVWFCLPDRPQKAQWLKDDEREWLLKTLADEHATRAAREQGAWHKHLGIVLLLTLVYFCQNAVAYSISTFMPSIVKAQVGTSENAAAWITALIYFVGFLGMQFNAWHSDHKHERIWHVAIPMLFVGTGLLLVSQSAGQPLLGLMFLIAFVGSNMYTHVPPFWAIPTLFLGSTAAASAIGFINMVGNFGGSVGPVIVGEAADQGDFATGLMRVAPFPLIAATIVLVIGYARRERKPHEPQ
jgi:ACS family tartrate transporter-like MFS transporter